MNNEYLGVKSSKRARANEANKRNIQVILSSAKDRELAMKKVRHKKKFSLDATQHIPKNSELGSKTPKLVLEFPRFVMRTGTGSSHVARPWSTSKRSTNTHKTNCASPNGQGSPVSANHKTTSRRKLSANKKSIKSIERTTTAHTHNWSIDPNSFTERNPILVSTKQKKQFPSLHGFPSTTNTKDLDKHKHIANLNQFGLPTKTEIRSEEYKFTILQKIKGKIDKNSVADAKNKNSSKRHKKSFFLKEKALLRNFKIENSEKSVSKSTKCVTGSVSGHGKGSKVRDRTSRRIKDFSNSNSGSFEHARMDSNTTRLKRQEKLNEFQQQEAQKITKILDFQRTINYSSKSIDNATVELIKISKKRTRQMSNDLPPFTLNSAKKSAKSFVRSHSIEPRNQAQSQKITISKSQKRKFTIITKTYSKNSLKPAPKGPKPDLRVPLHHTPLNGKIFWEHTFVFSHRIKRYLRICAISYLLQESPNSPFKFPGFFLG
jgi:hypothetical protein